MRKKLLILFALLALLGGACGGDDDSDDNGDGAAGDSTDAGDDAGPQTYTVKVDGKADAIDLATTAYFPNQLKVAAGSTIDFTSVFTGEPHTVTLGTLVDEGVKKALADPNATDEPAELKKLPPLLPDGPGDANQMAANPCFLASGDPPADKACPKVTQPEFDGTQTVLSSGFLPDGASFKVKLADDIEPGSYTFFCLLHRAGMTGTFQVVDADAADSPAEVEASGKQRLDTMAKLLGPTAAAAAKGEAPFAASKPRQVLAGGFQQETPEALLTSFGPKELSVKVGESVTWVIAGPHTVSFNAPEDLASSALVKAPDGAWHANEKAFTPSGGPGQPPPDPNAVPPAAGEPPAAPRLTDGGKFDGTGFRSSGVFVSFPPFLDAYELTFTKAGTYPYKCLIHPEMEGTVKVG